MAKYVCDFAAVTAIGDEVCEISSKITSAVNSYSSSIESNLSSWSGVAKQSFESTNSSQIAKAKEDAKYINTVGEYIKSAAKSIEALESELAGLSI